MAHDEQLELASLYALGVLETEERSRFEAHLATGCETCAASLRDSESVVEELAEAIAPLAPPPELKRRLFARVEADLEPRRTRAGWLWPAVAAASLVGALGLGLRARDLERELASARASRLDAERELAQLQESIGVMTEPGTRAVSLAGQEGAPNAVARAFIDPAQGRVLLYVYGLPSLPAGRTYQLWVIAAGEPRSAGVFGVAGDGSARLGVAPDAPLGESLVLAVTIEPEGGVPTPTGPIVLSSS